MSGGQNLKGVYLELGFLVLVVTSAGIGYLSRGKVSASIRRLIRTSGFIALTGGLLILGLTVLGKGPVGTWTAGLVAVILLVAAAAALPFSVAAGLGRD